MCSESDVGTIESRGGMFDGQRHTWPLASKEITITKSLVRHNECIGATYRDSGEVRFEGGERIRIFDLHETGTYVQTVPEDGV